MIYTLLYVRVTNKYLHTRICQPGVGEGGGGLYGYMVVCTGANGTTVGPLISILNIQYSKC